MGGVFDETAHSDRECVMLIAYSGPGNTRQWRPTNQLLGFTCTQFSGDMAEIVLAGVEKDT